MNQQQRRRRGEARTVNKVVKLRTWCHARELWQPQSEWCPSFPFVVWALEQSGTHNSCSTLTSCLNQLCSVLRRHQARRCTRRPVWEARLRSSPRVSPDAAVATRLASGGAHRSRCTPWPTPSTRPARGADVGINATVASTAPGCKRRADDGSKRWSSQLFRVVCSCSIRLCLLCGGVRPGSRDVPSHAGAASSAAP